MTATTNQRIKLGRDFDKLREMREAWEAEFFQTINGYDPLIKDYLCTVMVQNTMIEQNIKQIQEHVHFLHIIITKFLLPDFDSKEDLESNISLKEEKIE